MSEQTRALSTPPDAGTQGAQAPTYRRLGPHTAGEATSYSWQVTPARRQEDQGRLLTSRHVEQGARRAERGPGENGPPGEGHGLQNQDGAEAPLSQQ